MPARRRNADQPQPPVIRVAPLAELRAFAVYEHELDLLARGSTGSLFLNFALFLLPIGVTLLVTLLTTTIPSDRLFQSFVIVAAVAFLAGVILLLLWWREYQNAGSLVAEIKNRLPPPPALQRAAGGPSTPTESTSPERGEGRPPDQPQTP